MSLGAQEATTPANAFEVASVKPNRTQTGRAILFVPPAGEILLTRHSVEALVRYAYDLKSRYELTGGPEWASKELFDVRAVPPQGTAPAQIPRLMQALLAERFNLRIHAETRDTPVYALVPARVDRKPGPALASSKHDCAAFFATGATLGSPDVPFDEQGFVACGTFLAVKVGGLELKMLGVTPAAIANRLEEFAAVDRPVVDRTGLTGHFNAIVEFGYAVTIRNGPPVDPTAPTIFSAVQEQLGLKLEPRREPTQVLVIDSVEHPAPD